MRIVNCINCTEAKARPQTTVLLLQNSPEGSRQEGGGTAVCKRGSCSGAPEPMVGVVGDMVALRGAEC